MGFWQAVCSFLPARTMLSYKLWLLSISQVIMMPFISARQRKAVMSKVRRKYPAVLSVENQTPVESRDLHKDRQRSAMPSGIRVSASGKIYRETRSNRTDVWGKRA